MLTITGNADFWPEEKNSVPTSAPGRRLPLKSLIEHSYEDKGKLRVQVMWFPVDADTVGNASASEALRKYLFFLLLSNVYTSGENNYIDLCVGLLIGLPVGFRSALAE